MDMTPYSYREHILVVMPSGATLVHADVKGSPGRLLHQAKNIDDAKTWVNQFMS